MGGARGGQDADRRVGARGEASARGNARTGLRGWEPSGYDAKRIQSAEAAGSSGAWAGENDGTGTHRRASVRHPRRARVRDAEPGHQHRGDGASGDGGGLQNGSDSEKCRCRPSGEGLRWSVQAGHGAVAQQESRGAGVAPRRWPAPLVLAHARSWRREGALADVLQVMVWSLAADVVRHQR